MSRRMFPLFALTALIFSAAQSVRADEPPIPAGSAIRIECNNHLMLAFDPLSTSNGSANVHIDTSVPHGLVTGRTATLSGATPTNGIPVVALNGRFRVTVTSPTTFTINTGAAATASGTGGGRSVMLTRNCH